MTATDAPAIAWVQYNTDLVEGFTSSKTWYRVFRITLDGPGFWRTYVATDPRGLRFEPLHDGVTTLADAQQIAYRHHDRNNNYR